MFSRSFYFPSITTPVLIHRTANGSFFCLFFPDALNQVMVLRETSVFPKSEDLHGAAIALVRLQDTYLLNVTELADGHFTGVDHSRERGTKSCIITVRTE